MFISVIVSIYISL